MIFDDQIVSGIYGVSGSDVAEASREMRVLCDVANECASLLRAHGNDKGRCVVRVVRFALHMLCGISPALLLVERGKLKQELLHGAARNDGQMCTPQDEEVGWRRRRRTERRSHPYNGRVRGVACVCILIN